MVRLLPLTEPLMPLPVLTPRPLKKLFTVADFKKTKISQTDRDALQVMDLNDDVKWEQIHIKFKELVKKYHPDKNHGNKKFEEKLKKITLAYSQLKKTLGKK